ncbi:hypothetical protein AB4Z54_70065, partial [Streptomyces sp. MCAF7]
VEEAVEAGQAVAPRPRRIASLIMQTAMFTAQAPAAPVGAHPSPISADEVWEFCLGGITGAGRPPVDSAPAEKTAPRSAAAKRAPAKKATAKKATAKKAAAKKAVAKKATTPRGTERGKA